MSETEDAGRVSEDQLREMIAHAERDYKSAVQDDHRKDWCGPSREQLRQELSVLTELLALRAADHPAVGVRVKPLEWERVTDQIPKHAYAAYTPFNRWLIVCEFLSQNHMVYRFNGTDYETLEEAKAAAFDHYRNAILSCIEPLRPATEQAGGEVVADGWIFNNGTTWDFTFSPETAAYARVQGWGTKPLYASPPSPAATQSAVVSEEMVRELEQVRGLIISRARQVELREQDRCDFTIYIKMAVAELLNEGRITRTTAELALSNPGASQ